MRVAHGEAGGYPNALTGHRPQVQAALRLGAAAEAVDVMRGDLSTHREGMYLRLLSRLRGLQARRWSSRTHGSPA